MTAIASRLSFNVLTNVFTTLLNAFCGFIILPFLISQLGRDTYGFWTLIVASVGYFLVLDIGVSGAIGRLIAAHRGEDDVRAINAVLSTTLILLCGVSVVVFALSFLLRFPFFWLFEVPEPQKPDIAATLLVMGFGSALYFPPLAAHALLWGYERFDAINFVEIPTVLLRTGLTLWLIQSGSQLVELAWIVVGVSAAGYVARTAACFWIEPRLQLRPSLFSRAIVKDVFSFGIWFSLLTFFRSATPNIAPFVIGHTLGAGPVTTFTIPRMLVSYSSWVMVSATQVAAPKAAVYHFGKNPGAQQALFIEGSRYNWAFTLFFLGGAIFLGYSLLSLWQSAPQPEEYRLLLILMAGELIPLSQWVTYYAAVSMGQHRRLAEFALAEAVTIVILAYAFSRWWGLEGAAAAVAISAFVFRGLLQVVYGCRLIGTPVARYVRLVFAPLALGSLLPYALIGALAAWFQPISWLELLVIGSVYTALFWSVLGWQLGLIPARIFKLRRSV
jgi:O-antigen/teichoic acid export membrane protein